MDDQKKQSPLYLVFGGKMDDVGSLDFQDNSSIETVGYYRTMEDACNAWRSISQKHVDHAYHRYFIVALHENMRSSVSDACPVV